MDQSRSAFRLVLLLSVGAATLTAGCMPLGTTRYPDSRRPDARYPDTRRYPDAQRYPDTRTAQRAIYTRAARDADRYVRALDREIGLDRRQERRIRDLLADRAYDRVARKARRDRDRYYPFPRRAADRRNRSWWSNTDRKIERLLDRRQRHAYRDVVRDHARVERHDQRRHKRKNRGRG